MSILKVSGIVLISVVVYSCGSPQSVKEESIVPFPDESVVSVSEKAVDGRQKNWETVGVKGKVKSIVCTDYKQFVPNSSLSNYVTKENFIFDRNGNVLEEMCYAEDQRFSFRYQYFYDKMGNCLKTVSLAEKGDSILFVDLDKINKQGLFVSSKTFTRVPVKPGSSKYKINTREFGNDYKLISDSQVIYEDYDVRGKRKVKNGFRNEEHYVNGNLMLAYLYSEGKFLSKGTYKYDSRNNNTLWIDSTSTGVRTYETVYDIYDRKTYSGIQSTETGNFNETFYMYDLFGNVIKKLAFKKSVPYKRDSYMDTYTFDKQNNWIKRERRKMTGEKISVVKRKITYY